MDIQKQYSAFVRVFFPKFSREEIVREIERCVRKFHESLGLCKVILFGSYARGNYTVASDIDILIVYDDKKCNENEIRKTLMKNIKLPRVELHILSIESFNASCGLRWIKTIENEGIKILNK
ncbi:nucleotidyltransferase domain-containing protein [Candidatus Bathyarchaeota archaeon]|nr:nucleotidyltransferase domain-containing protein [Candidatus Bathyarchaeota archaeon]MBS7628095.1 nucleotidyltransferase domain-containing protein [Candidatus Bathyarchaeota archaeon]